MEEKITKEHALKIIRAMRTNWDENSKTPNAHALDMAAEALEKQIPMKPKIVEVNMEGMDMETGEECIYKIDEAHCCNCNSVIGSEYDRFDEHYCNKCGLKIDWSEWDCE